MITRYATYFYKGSVAGCMADGYAKAQFLFILWSFGFLLHSFS